MLNKLELESILGCKITDEQWSETQKALDDAADREWNEAHPMDD